jgi:hypothetical protein
MRLHSCRKARHRTDLHTEAEVTHTVQEQNVLHGSFKSPVNDFVYSFGRAALLLLVEV